ncbi:MAG: hypothetical protein R3344_05180 [Acidobacteriota bacterium]|nr:hypothetical protein [Acidobacteriota bacterium]
MSPTAKILARFFLVLILVYGVLAVPWPAVRAGYAAVYRGVANVVFGSFGGDGIVRFEPAGSDEAGMDTLIQVRRRGSSVVGTTTHDSRLTGYLPTIEVVALILATPVAWSRRWRALLWGLLAAHLFVGLRLYITLLRWFAGDAPWCLYDPGPVGTTVLVKVFEVAVVSPTLTYVVPLFIWIVATFRASDLSLLTTKNGVRH